MSYKVNERPIVFVTYSLGVLIVKRVSSGYWTDIEGADVPGSARGSKVRSVIIVVSLHTRHGNRSSRLSDQKVANIETRSFSQVLTSRLHINGAYF